MPQITTNGAAFAALLSIILALGAAFGFDLKVEPETVVLAGMGIAILANSFGLFHARNNLDSDQKVGARPDAINVNAVPTVPLVVAPALPEPAQPQVIVDRRAPVQPAPIIVQAVPAVAPAPIPVTITQQTEPVPVTETTAPASEETREIEH